MFGLSVIYQFKQFDFILFFITIHFDAANSNKSMVKGKKLFNWLKRKKLSWQLQEAVAKSGRPTKTSIYDVLKLFVFPKLIIIKLLWMLPTNSTMTWRLCQMKSVFKLSKYVFSVLVFLENDPAEHLLYPKRIRRPDFNLHVLI